MVTETFSVCYGHPMTTSPAAPRMLIREILADEARREAVRKWGEERVAATEADVAARFDRPRKGLPFHPMTNTGRSTR